MKKNRISKNWINKQRRDIYVRKSKIDGYRARSAYKLIEIDEKFKIFKGGMFVLDIGAAPGSWSQYAEKISKNGKLISIDLKKMEPIGNSLQIQGDFTEESVQQEIKKNTESKVDVVMSDMAVNTTGIKNVDSIQTGELCKEAMIFSKDVINEKGFFIALQADNKVIGWASVEDALAGNQPTMSFGGKDDKSALGTKMASAVGWDGVHLWVGEFKFSNRLLGFLPSR